MRSRKPKNNVRLGAILLVVVAALAYLAVTRDVPFIDNPYTIKAAFAESNGLKSGSPVRIAGVDVGKVKKVESEGNSGAVLVTMAIDKKGQPIHTDATAKIRPRIFLEGNFFVELTAGRPSSPVFESGGTIPESQTANPVQLDQVLRILKSDTRLNLRDTVDSLAETEKAGGGAAARKTLDYQSGAYKYSAIVADALLGETPGDLGKYIHAQGTVAQALTKSPADLIGLVVNLDTTFGALADEQSALQAGVNELPRTLNAALPTLSALDAAFPAVRRFARLAQPGIKSVGPTVDVTLPLVRQLRGLVRPSELRGLSRDLRAATPPLVSLSQTAVPVLESIREIASCANDSLIPYGNETLTDPSFPATGKVFQDIPKSFVGLAGESRSFDANGQFFKVLGQGGTTTISLGNGMMGSTGATPVQGVRPAAQPKRPPLEPGQPCENQEPPDLRADTGAAPAQTKINLSDPKVVERTKLAELSAADVLRDQIASEGRKLKVSDTFATPAQVAKDVAEQKALVGK